MKADHKKRKMINASILAVIIMILITAGSVIYLGFKMHDIQKGTDMANNEYYEHHYVLITDDRDSLFWQSVYEGAKNEAEETNAYIEFLGENLSKNYDETELMRIAISERVDGIIIEANENIALKRLINEANIKGIPVVTALNDCYSSARVSYVGVNSYNIGTEYGKQVCFIAEKFFAKQHGNNNTVDKKDMKNNDMNVLVLMDSAADNTNQNIVFSGIQDVIDSDSKYNDRISIKARPINTGGAFVAEEAIRDIFMGKGEIPDVIICLDELNTTCVYQTVVDYNKVGQVSIIGYYQSDTILKAIKRNVIRASVSINTKQMGALCVKSLNEYIERGRVSDYSSVDTAVITSENVKNFQEETEDEE